MSQAGESSGRRFFLAGAEGEGRVAQGELTWEERWQTAGSREHGGCWLSDERSASPSTPALSPPFLSFSQTRSFLTCLLREAALIFICRLHRVRSTP